MDVGPCTPILRTVPIPTVHSQAAILCINQFCVATDTAGDRDTDGDGGDASDRACGDGKCHLQTGAASTHSLILLTVL